MTPAEVIALATNMQIAASPGGIERQEAAGQRELLERNILPREIKGGTCEQLAQFGLKFGEDVDDLFVECELPSGWTKKAGAWDTHNDLLDEKGRIRAFLFFKAAFYDRQAYMSLRCRFKVDLYGKAQDDDHRFAAVTDSGNVILALGEWRRSDRATSDAYLEQGRAWLAQHYPRWESPLAYWD